MTDRKLMQQALDALEAAPMSYRAPATMEALRARLAQPEAQPVRLPLVQATAPRKIWLQISDEAGDSAEQFPNGHDGITWCEDSVLECEVPYVRADLATPQAQPIDGFGGNLDAAFAPAPAPVVPDGWVTAREVAREVFALCEACEDLPNGEMDSQEVERFKAGQRFAAKNIRRAIGTWLTDEESTRAAAPGSAPAVPAVRPPMEDPDCNYIAPMGKVCNKCGRIHRGIGTQGGEHG